MVSYLLTPSAQTTATLDPFKLLEKPLPLRPCPILCSIIPLGPLSPCLALWRRARARARIRPAGPSIWVRTKRSAVLEVVRVMLWCRCWRSGRLETMMIGKSKMKRLAPGY